jgi:uncharacterized protein
LTAVSNSSPLILYSRIGQLGLLQTLFDEILVPPAVWHEVVVAGAGRAGQREVDHAEWIRIHPLPRPAVSTQFAFLDPGEAEALTLASSLDTAVPILIDDEQARRVAEASELFPIGSGGILVRAKEAGLISSVRPHLMELRSAGLFLGDRAFRRVLERADEQ